MITPTPATREFLLIVDPHCVDELAQPALNTALALIADLGQIDPPVNIHLVFPIHLATDEQLERATALAAQVHTFEHEAGVHVLELSQDLRRQVRERIERGAEGDQRGLRLLALAEHLKGDGIVTMIPSLVDARHALLRNHKFRILPPRELPEFVEICARGHLLSCSASPPLRWLPQDVLYQYTHWKARRLFDWFSRVGSGLADNTLREHLRSALLNRYPFILHARDMIRFFELQKDYHFRRGRKSQVFRGLLNYHLTSFYVHVWGMLDALAGIANQHLGLGLDPRRCGIDNDRFLDALKGAHPGLTMFIKKHRAEWIAVIGDVRHPVAHSALRLQQDIAIATEESKKSEADVSAILHQEHADVFAIMPPEFMAAMEPMLIQNWRIDKMKIISDDAIYVERPDGGGYFRHPVISIDFDLERLNAFIDAFLVACFAK